MKLFLPPCVLCRLTQTLRLILSFAVVLSIELKTFLHRVILQNCVFPLRGAIFSAVDPSSHLQNCIFPLRGAIQLHLCVCGHHTGIPQNWVAVRAATICPQLPITLTANGTTKTPHGRKRPKAPERLFFLVFCSVSRCFLIYSSPYYIWHMFSNFSYLFNVSFF